MSDNVTVIYNSICLRMHLFVLSLESNYFIFAFDSSESMIMTLVELAECFRMATCKSQSENQNITAYGILLFVSGLTSFFKI